MSKDVFVQLTVGRSDGDAGRKERRRVTPDNVIARRSTRCRSFKLGSCDP